MKIKAGLKLEFRGQNLLIAQRSKFPNLYLLNKHKYYAGLFELKNSSGYLFEKNGKRYLLRSINENEIEIKKANKFYAIKKRR